MTVRERLRTVVEASWFQNAIITVIMINAGVLGLETSPRLVADYGPILHTVDSVILAIFVTELLVRGYVYRTDFFRDPWSIFDLIIVGIALVPSSGPFAVLRVLRVMRVLRLVSVLPALRRVVTGLLRALPGMASIGLLLALLMYVAGVMGTLLFQRIDPENFGSLGGTLFTLFQVMTGDSWASEIARPILEQQPLAWVFFVVFILLSTFITLNLFIAVAVEALPSSHGEGEQDRARQREDLILSELRALREEVERLRADREDRGDSEDSEDREEHTEEPVTVGRSGAHGEDQHR